MIHDVIRTAYPFPYTAEFMFAGVRNDKTEQIRCWKMNRIHTTDVNFIVTQKMQVLVPLNKGKQGYCHSGVHASVCVCVSICKHLIQI